MVFIFLRLSQALQLQSCRTVGEILTCSCRGEAARQNIDQIGSNKQQIGWSSQLTQLSQL